MSASAPRPSIVSLIGTVLDGRYRIQSLLGEGGMGAVFRAQQQSGPDVAIKVLREELGDQPDVRERFEREARALFGLQHAHILGVHDFGIVNGSPYLVMELLQGMPLDKYIEESPPDPTTAIAIVRQLLSGLAFAHAQGAVHRDLKTENVFVAFAPDGSKIAKLLDFGLVKFVDDDRWGKSNKLTMQGAVFGTPAYMSPEQCSGAPADMRSDVYSMGVILFELLTGAWPFMEETRLDMFRAQLTRPPPSIMESSETIDVKPELEAVYQRALSKKAPARFANAGEMLAAIDAIAPPAAWPRGERASRYTSVRPATAAQPGGGITVDTSPGISGDKTWVFLAVGIGGVVVIGAIAAALLLGG